MRINYNVSASLANKHLLGIENNLSRTMERLSSGVKLNHSKDNPAGMAVSNKMQMQINGLDRASKNASDGISVIRIADGALNEVTSILQRMRELSVQAASDATMSLDDKRAVQDEIDNLTMEVDRVSRDTEYNTKTLLNGSLDTRVYADHVSRIQISDQVEAGDYSMEITTAATQATIASGANFNGTGPIGVEGTISVNGAKAEILATDTYEEAYEKIRNAAEGGNVTAERDGATGAVTFTSNLYGKNGSIEIAFSDEQLAQALSLSDNKGSVLVEETDPKRWVFGSATTDSDGNTIGVPPTGTEMVIAKNNDKYMEGLTSSATVSTDGNRVTFTDINGVSFSFLADAGYTGTLDFEVTELGPMTLHIGANMDQNMKVRIPEVSSESLYIDDLDVTTVLGAGYAMDKLDWAIAKVSDVRSSLGAYENRLDYAVDSLDTFEENMTSAFSRLADADMADEMTEYTHQNVLNQAAISVLTQANDLPQQVLQILQ